MADDSWFSRVVWSTVYLLQDRLSECSNYVRIPKNMVVKEDVQVVERKYSKKRRQSGESESESVSVLDLSLSLSMPSTKTRN